MALFGGRARAQSAEAEQLFNDGDRLMTEGKFAQACDSFEASNRIEARAGTLIRLGDCREKNNQLASAWSAYKDSLTRVKDPKKRELAEQRIAAIEPHLSYLTVSVPDESRVDGLELSRNGKPLDPALWNRAIPVDGGEYVIGGKAPGHEEWNTKVTVATADGKVTVDVPKFKELQKLIEPDDKGKGKDTTITTAVTPESPGMFTTQREIALGVGGAGVIVGIVGIVEGLGASSDKTNAYTLCPDPAMPCANAKQAQELIDSGHSKATIANVSYGVAAAAVIGAAALWFTGAPAEAEPRVSIVPELHRGGASVGVSVRF
ncbi:MAG TPA: hypothetical protein VL463_08620 [Kofleriaceae bacterium]|nr:hypothetical protein [Kofleriaceae bacterium]